MAMFIAGRVIRDRRKFYLNHILIMSLMLGITIVLVEGAVVVPFIFSIFLKREQPKHLINSLRLK